MRCYTGPLTPQTERDLSGLPFPEGPSSLFRPFPISSLSLRKCLSFFDKPLNESQRRTS